MPKKKRPLTQACEKRRRKLAAAQEASPLKQRRLETLRSNSRQIRYQQQLTLVPITSTVAPEVPSTAPQQPLPEAPSTAPHQPLPEAPSTAPQQPLPEAPSTAPQQPLSEAPSTAPQQPLPEAPSTAPQQPLPQAQCLSTAAPAPQQPVRDNVDLRQDIARKRAQERLPPSYCCAKLLRSDSEVNVQSVGAMDQVCMYCSAKLFRGELLQGSSSICCHKGKIKLPPVVVCDELLSLIEANDVKTNNYLNNVRKFDNALAFASVQVNAINLPGRGPFVFKIHGQVYHSVGALNPPQGQAPSYAGLFVIDTEEALQHRVSHEANRQCDIDIMTMLQAMLERVNPYAALFHFLKDRLTEVSDLQLMFSVDNSFDPRRYNVPTVNEIAAVFTSADGAPPGKFDFVMYSKATGSLVKISYLNPHCDPLCYPLLFPCGEGGFRPGMQYVSVFRTAVRNSTTQLQYYCYRLALRGDFNLIHSSGKLFQQYVVDSFVKVEGSRLAFIRAHQKELRAESYQGLIDFMQSDAGQRGIQAGIPVILPSSFLTSPRNMLQNYQDSMSIVTRYGKPDLFVTFTCNPRWPEITSELQPYHKVENRPDLVTRVFQLKLKALLNDLLKGDVLGVVIAHVYVIEFQKRGLPHAHILLILRDSDKFRDKDHVDSVVCAEIPDCHLNPRLFNIVKQCMVHGPCGTFNQNSICMKDGQCSKGFPKEFNNETNMNVNGYPLYRRRDTGVTVSVGPHRVDNRWIVPYNPYLSLRYDAHINVEVCSSIRSVKYLYKYVYKGHDCTSLQLRSVDGQQQLNLDEVDLYLNCRYVSPPEAMWRLHERILFDRSHSVQRLPVHLPAEHTVYFNPGDDITANMDRPTKLTAFFSLCQSDEAAREYFYSQIPELYTWDKGVWRKRKRFANTIGRMFTVNPADCERYFLRMLLLHVKGPKSFDDIKTVDGVLCASFQEAAQKLHLLDDDQEWNRCLEEAVASKMPSQLRQLFAVICLFCAPSNIPQLWETFQEHLSEDFSRHHDIAASANRALNKIDAIFRQHGKKCEDFGLPKPTYVAEDHADTYDADDQRARGVEAYEKLNAEQRPLADEILEAVRSGNGKSYFIDGPGGTGKTFLYATLCYMLRGEGKTVLPIAWTGIAASLLEGGRTSHSLFKLPVPVLETSVSRIRPHSKQADLIRQASLIIWDEVSMVPKEALNVVDRLLKDICNNNLPNGGKNVVYGGDFRQVLPVVRHGNRTTIVESCVKQSPLWHCILKRQLTLNMRANDDPAFSEWLLQLGNGQLPIEVDISPDAVKIPKHCYVPHTDFVQKVFQTVVINETNVEQFIDRAILCPKNDNCAVINNHVVENIVSGQCKIYFSHDSVKCDDTRDQTLYPDEFLHSIEHSGLPPHKLALKVNTTVMLIRNLNAKKGLINGARMVITHLGDFTITAKLISSGTIVIIPRIDLTPSDPTIPFNLCRRQFPIKIAYAMTINKAQGQTLKMAGLYLPDPVFSHGQLYVAFSRVRSFANLLVSLNETDKQVIRDDHIITSNVVFKEVL